MNGLEVATGSFEPIILEWEGKQYVIKRNRVLGAIARIEDHISIGELARIGRGEPPPMAKFAMAFASVLRYAGATVTDDEVYVRTFGAKGKDADLVITAVHTLLAMMIPPERLSSTQRDAVPGKAVPAAAKGSSRKRTRRRSARGG